ncbi:hypothetical protein [Candidatus Sarmatiella mevalonica]|uniref:hypothetical protein n=1 Tax=Candidatus Sarmatiella mevalonica TaxID=2770581 RepID=UPI0019223DE6|nr:hypothetical protein [Candidatus Sarmatiella mevalonica]
MRGVYKAQSRSVHEVREDSSIGATKQLPSGVELGKRSIKSIRVISSRPNL